MAIQKVIRGEEGTISRWQPPEVDVPPVPAKPKEEPAEQQRPGMTVAELEALQKAAYDEGFDQGRADGEAKGREEGFAAGKKDAAALAVRIGKVLDTLAEPVRELDAQVEQQLTELALTIARQIIRREIAAQPGEIMGVVREAVALLPLSARDIQIRLHPEDGRFLREALGQSEEASAWKLVDDPSITRGGCRVLSPTSRIDATLERRLTQLCRDLLGGERGDDEAGHEPA